MSPAVSGGRQRAGTRWDSRSSAEAHVKLAVSLTLSMFIATAIAHAQQPTTLTLATALEKAERQNLELAAARERRALVSAEVQIAGQRPNPTLNFGVTRDTPHESFLVDQPIE